MKTPTASTTQLVSNTLHDPLVAWHQRPVFVVQCKTWKLVSLLGVCVHRFRCLPGHRDVQAISARRQVEMVIRVERKRIARMKVVREKLALVSRHNPVTGYLVDVQASLDLRYEYYSLEECQDPFFKMLR